LDSNSRLNCQRKGYAKARIPELREDCPNPALPNGNYCSDRCKNAAQRVRSFEERKASMRRWQKKNRKQRRAYNNEWRRKNPEKVKAHKKKAAPKYALRRRMLYESRTPERIADDNRKALEQYHRRYPNRSPEQIEKDKERNRLQYRREQELLAAGRQALLRIERGELVTAAEIKELADLQVKVAKAEKVLAGGPGRPKLAPGETKAFEIGPEVDALIPRARLALQIKAEIPSSRRRVETLTARLLDRGFSKGEAELVQFATTPQMLARQFEADRRATSLAAVIRSHQRYKSAKLNVS